MDDDSFSSFAQMREYIMATEYLMQPECVDQEILSDIMESSVVPQANTCLLEDLQDVVFRLRAFTESANDEMALGIELGMQRAADMIEHVIFNHRFQEQPGE